MFKHKNNKKLWITLIIIIVLVVLTLLMQTQMYVILKDLQTTIFGDFFIESNPMPPMREGLIDSNPMPPMAPINLFK